MLNPGLAPWAMQEYRPYRALLRPHQLLAYSDALALASSLIQMLACSDAFVFASSLIKCLLVLMRLSSHAPNEMLTYLRMCCWVLWCGVVLFSIFVTK